MSDNKNLAIQSLKGIAALVVVLSHTFSMVNNTVIASLHNTWVHLFFDGQCAVIVFFAITGFFSYKDRNINIKEFTRTYWTGIIRKFIRLTSVRRIYV